MTQYESKSNCNPQYAPCTVHFLRKHDITLIAFTHNLSNFVVFLFLALFPSGSPRTGFDKSSLERLEQLFIKTVGNEKEIRREEFKKIVTSKNVSTHTSRSRRFQQEMNVSIESMP